MAPQSKTSFVVRRQETERENLEDVQSLRVDIITPAGRTHAVTKDITPSKDHMSAWEALSTGRNEAQWWWSSWRWSGVTEIVMLPELTKTAKTTIEVAGDSFSGQEPRPRQGCQGHRMRQMIVFESLHHQSCRCSLYHLLFSLKAE